MTTRNSGGHPIDIQWPDDETLLKEIVEAGSYALWAQPRGIAPSTVNSRLGRQGLRERYHEMRKKVVLTPRPSAKVDEAESLRQELGEARIALRQARSEDVREQRVIDAIVGAIGAKKASYRPATRRKAKLHQHTFVLLWSDVHAGEVVSPSEVGGMNDYDWSIMLARQRELFNAVASYADHRNYDVNELVVCGLGDVLSGNIHSELKETNELPLADAVVQAGLDMADWLEQFTDLFTDIRFAGVIGNHGRESQKPQAKRKYSNADWVAYQIMRQRLSRNKAISFDIPRSPRHPLKVYGSQLLLFHGDGVGPSAMVGVPWGGIVRHVGRLRNQYAGMGLAIDHFLCGHFHEANAVSAKRIIVNGSVVGASEYSLERFGEASPPEQILLTFNRNHGLVDVSFIQLKAGLPT